MRSAIVPIALVGFVVGCGNPAAVTPLPTDGPNQVVLSVPSMT